MKRILTLALAVAALSSCRKEPIALPALAGRVTIDPVITRATDVNFEDGDRIGLAIKKADESLHADNKLMTFADGVFASDLVWYAEANDEALLTAYYPYSETGIPTSFSVAADQSETGYGASDLIAAVKSGVLPSINSVSMNFRHMLTNIVVNVENESGMEISSVVLQGACPAADVDLAEFTVKANETSSKTDIITQQVAANETYRAIVVPQTVAFTLAVTTSDNKTLTQKLAYATLKQHGQYSVNVRVLSGELKVTMSGEIENWTDQGSIAPESGVQFEEYEDYFIYDGVRYNTVTFANGTIWMADPIRYLPEGLTPSPDPLANSHIWYPYEVTSMPEGNTNVNFAKDTPELMVALTGEEDIKKFGYLYDVYAAFGREVTLENYASFEGQKGICPQGWHIPTRAEYFDLVGASNSNTNIGEPTGTRIYEDAVLFGLDGSGKKYASIQNARDAGFNFQYSGMRFYPGYPEYTEIIPRYQYTVICQGNSTKTEWYGQLANTYYMTSTAYKPNYSTSIKDEDGNFVLTNIQFFGLMTTFTTSAYPEGRLSLAFSSAYSGNALRCVKDHDIDFYEKHKGQLNRLNP